MLPQNKRSFLKVDIIFLITTYVLKSRDQLKQHEAKQSGLHFE